MDGGKDSDISLIIKTCVMFLQKMLYQSPSVSRKILKDSMAVAINASSYQALSLGDNCIIHIEDSILPYIVMVHGSLVEHRALVVDKRTP